MTRPPQIADAANLLVEQVPITDPRVAAADVTKAYPRFTYVDHGTDRIVFTVDAPLYDDKVVKIARREQGYAANEQEYRNWRALRNGEYGEWLCPVREIGGDGAYVVMDYTDTSRGDDHAAQRHLAPFPPEDIVPSNVGYHPERGTVLIDYSWSFNESP